MPALIFDLDETLILEHDAVKAAFEETCLAAALKHKLDVLHLAATVRHRGRELWHRSPAYAWCLAIGISSWEGLSGDLGGASPELAALRDWAEQSRFRATAWTQALAEFGVDDVGLAAELAARLVQVRRRYHIPYPETETVLTALRGGYRLALLTNGAPRLQREKITALGLAKYFDAIVISGEVGLGKPDPRVFELVLDQLGAAAEESAMVGDSLQHDIAGANATGLRSIWLNRTGRQPRSDVRPDMTVTALDELLERPVLPGERAHT